MADIVISQAVDMTDQFFFFDFISSVSSTEITATEGDYVATIFGSFTFPTPATIAGTITGLQQALNGALQFTVDGLDLSASETLSVIENGTLEEGIDFVLGGDDTVAGSNQRDVLFASFGDDKVRANGGNDVVYGEEGKDQLWGAAGKDKLNGGKGADKMWGGDDNDVLKGGGGKDRLNGDGGNDKLFGGKGGDTFIFRASQEGKDRIMDFNANRDEIQINGATIDDVEASTRNGNTTLTFGEGSVVLRGVELDVEDITFVFA